MTPWALFTDGSLDPRSRIGFGAYIAAPTSELPTVPPVSAVVVKRFEHTSSSQLELQALLWALDNVAAPDRHLSIHTDSQTIVGLPARRSKLEESQFTSRQGRPLSNRALYRKFFDALDHGNVTLHKVRGHRPQKEKNQLERWFGLVDRAARSALR